MTELTHLDPSHQEADGFAAELESRVRHHVEELTAAHAVDEANGDVLDSFIDAAVAEHVEHLAARTARQEQVLRRIISTLTVDRAQAQQTEQDARQRLSAQADHVLGLRASITGLTTATGADAGVTELDPQRLRAFAESRRALLEGERTSAAGRPFRRSAGRLRLRKESAERRARARASVLAEHQSRLAEADARLAEALLRFRGDTPVIQNGGTHVPA